MVCNCNSCNQCGPSRDCYTCNDNCVRVEYVPGTSCTIAITHEDCTTTFNLSDGVKACETDTYLRFEDGCFIYESERHDDTICMCEVLESVSIGCLGDVELDNVQPCDIMVWDPECDGPCANCPGNRAGQLKNYHIPDAGDCVVEPNENGMYNVLVKNDCGCIKECQLPTANYAVNMYVRDSVPDDPDFPWYYGQYNDKINLYLAQNAGDYFGNFDLKVTVFYGVQCVRPDAGKNVNWRSFVVPVVEGEDPDAEHMGCILQDDSTAHLSNPSIPWGTKSMRGALSFVVPKGKEAYLHHEFRLRTSESFPNYQTNALDGQIVPANIAAQIDQMAWNASRLNQLQVIVEPVIASVKKAPVVDVARNQLDPAVDIYPNPAQA